MLDRQLISCRTLDVNNQVAMWLFGGDDSPVFGPTADDSATGKYGFCASEARRTIQ